MNLPDRGSRPAPRSVDREADRPWTISAIIPALDEEHAIRATIAALQAVPEVGEIIVVDGGSVDGTAREAHDAGAVVVVGERGRGIQQRRGAAAAGGDALWFVHADTVVPPEAGVAARSALRDDGCAGASFRVRFAGPSFNARAITAFYALARAVGIRYGDAAYIVRRDAYDASGGFRDLAIFEDQDLHRRLRRIGRFKQLDPVVETSSRRFERRSLCMTIGRWTALQLAFWAGVPAERLGRHYLPVRENGPSTDPAGSERAAT